ncbi:hypothetical protein BQ8794_130017 [Mesorhizobium prunaredense]|uniref:Uncharacterized protein n=1 Tax=Mesorhizobium prunaredense TaxID=1631249 RepID=A0A1R3V0X1_9HYPH|nr:hypothetical protein BQ8794_130017 [Mesorhizobium prunaredense]
MQCRSRRRFEALRRQTKISVSSLRSIAFVPFAIKEVLLQRSNTGHWTLAARLTIRQSLARQPVLDHFGTGWPPLKATRHGHEYKIQFRPLRSFVTGGSLQIGQLTSAHAPIPNEPMEVIMSDQVANSNATGWHTTLDSSTLRRCRCRSTRCSSIKRQIAATLSRATSLPRRLARPGPRLGLGPGPGLSLLPATTSDGTLYGTSGADVLKATGAQTMIGYGALCPARQSDRAP